MAKKSKIANTYFHMISKIVFFIVLTLLMTIVFAVIQQNSSLSFERISLPQLAPAFAVIILYFFYKNLPSKVNLNIDIVLIPKYLTAFLLPIALFGLAYFLTKQIGVEVKPAEDLKKLVPIMLTGMVIGAFAEEIGWRSYLQPTIENEYSPLKASIFTGLIWGLWHIGHYKNGVLFMIGFLLFTVSASILISWLLRETSSSLIIAGLFHLAINLSFLIFFKNSMTDAKFMLVNGLIWLLPALILILTLGQNFSKT